MTVISVVLVGPTGAGVNATVPDDSQMRLLSPAIASTIGYPSLDVDGSPLVYRFRRESTAAVLEDDQTLASAGVHEGERLIALPMKLAPAEITSSCQSAPVTQRALTAPVRIPSPDSLTIGLVPSDLVYRLEEYRSDQRRWEALAWIFLGAALGIIVNWVTEDPIVISRSSLVFLVLFLVLAGLIGLISWDFRRRAASTKGKIDTASGA